MNYNDTFGKRLAAVRKSKQISQETLAEKLGLTTGSIGKIEIGQSKPSFDTLVGLCKELKISADYLLFGDESTHIVSEPKTEYGTDWKDKYYQCIEEKDKLYQEIKIYYDKTLKTAPKEDKT